MKKIFLLVLFTLLFGSPKSFAQFDQFIGQISVVGFNFAPQGWMMCEGQLLPISEYEALFSLIGTTYGGDGQTTFALPDYRGRVLVGVGQGPGLTNRTLGEASGFANVTLTVANLPAHTHAINANSGVGTTNIPTNNVLANTGILDKEFGTTPNTTLGATGSAGSNSPSAINTTQPYLGLYYIIAVEGIFPSRQ